MSRVDDVSAAPAETSPAATDEPRTTTTDQDEHDGSPSALERALAALGMDEDDLDDGQSIEGEDQAQVAGVDPRKVRQLRLLKEHAGGLKAQHDDLTAAVKDLEREVVRSYGDAGIRSLTIDDYTASLSCRTWVSPADDVESAAMCQAMADYGGEWAALVPPKYHAQQLSSHVNALDEQGIKLPDEIEAVIKRTDTWGVGFRKAARGRSRGKRVPTTGD